MNEHNSCCFRPAEVGEMLIRKMRKMHRRAHEEFQQALLRRQTQTDQLLMILFQIVSIWLDKSPADHKQTALGSLLDHQAESVIELCRVHQSLIRNDHLGFLWKHFRGHRAVLFSIIEELRLIAPGRDKRLEWAIAFLKRRRRSQEEWMKIDSAEGKLDLSWIPDRWWKQMTGREKRAAEVEKVDRRYFEMCVFTLISESLQSGDLVIEGSGKFSDYQDQFISDAEFQKAAPEYCRQAGLPSASRQFVDHLHEWLSETARKVDVTLPENECLSIVCLRKRRYCWPIPWSTLSTIRRLAVALRARMPSASFFPGRLRQANLKPSQD